jgi:hypothetical protein
MFRHIVLILLVLSLTFTVAYADTYKYVDEGGVITLSDMPPPSSAREMISHVEKTRVTKRTRADYSEHYYNYLIRNKAYKYNVDPSLIEAIISVESNFNSRAVSSKGAMGLMQLMPSTAKAMGVYNPFDPEDNIEAGVRYLKYLLKRFNGDLRLALAAYNAGPTLVNQYGTVPPFKETVQYLKKIFSLYRGGTSVPVKSYTASSTVRKNIKIYKIVLKDGSVLYTNSESYQRSPSSY